jgi:hypothetical protein
MELAVDVTAHLCEQHRMRASVCPLGLTQGSMKLCADHVCVQLLLH